MHFGDTAFGQLLRVFSGRKLFAHPESSTQIPPGSLYDEAALESSKTVADDAYLEPGTDNTPSWLLSAARWGIASSAQPSSDSQTSSQPNELQLPGVETPTSFKDVNREGLVDWYGDNDPANPQNWSSYEKAFAAGVIYLYTFTVYLGSAIYTPSVIGVMQEFGVSYAAANVGLALFVFGYGAGAMIFSPMSEIPSLGRNWIYIITFVMYLAFTVGTAVAPNYGSLITLRFLAGFVGSPALATGGATLQDMYGIVKFPYSIALWVAAASMGPALGPVMGGFAAAANTWRWPMWIQVWLSGPVLIIMFFCLPETSAQNILLRRARRLRTATEWKNLHSKGEIEQRKITAQKLVVDSLIRPVQISILDPGTGFMNAYVALVYGIYYSFFESFPLIYPVIYGFGQGTTGLAFICVVITTGIGAAGYIYYVYYHVEPKIRETGVLPPLESRLIPAIPASIMMPIGLFLYAWTSRASVHWMAGLVGVGIYSIGFYVFLQCVLLYVPLMYPKYSASLLAANDFCRSGLAAGFVMAGRPLFRNLGIGGGVSLLAGLTCLCVPILMLLYYYGPMLRSRSKFTDMPATEKRARLLGTPSWGFRCLSSQVT